MENPLIKLAEPGPYSARGRSCSPWVFIVRLKVGRANHTERWQITGPEAVYPTADEALAALQGDRRRRDSRLIFALSVLQNYQKARR